MKIDKRYTIKFSKSGINQYADFYEKGGKLIDPRLYVNYAQSGEVPSVENLTTIDEVLEVIKSISYCNRAELYMIDGQIVSYYNNTKAKECLSNFEDSFKKFIESESIKFFEEILEPIMKKNKWFISTSHIGMPILIEKNEEGEWDNIKGSKEFDFEYLCSRFVSNFEEVEVHLKGEHNNWDRAFNTFLRNIPNPYLEERGLFITID